jgi:Na+-translocating ferredoxin:NAD+ oxidoreductase RnfC subunit
VGVSFRELLALAGGATVPDFGLFVSGIMMGTARSTSTMSSPRPPAG